jgi:hypothetical protein
MIERAFPAILLLALAACGGDGGSDTGSGSTDSGSAAAPAPAVQPAPANSQPAASASAPVVLDSGGVSVTDAAGRPVTLRYGMDRAEVVSALTRAAGAPGEQGENAECGGGASTFARWANGLTLWFQDDQFGGWAVDDRAPAAGLPRTASGVSIGSTRAALEGAYTATVEETSLGQEFNAQGIYGVLSGTAPDARITALWSGTTCIFR